MRHCLPSPGLSRNVLRQNSLDDVSVNIRQPEIAALRPERQTRMINAERAEDGGIEVVDMDRILRDVIAEVVCLRTTPLSRPRPPSTLKLPP